MHLEKFETFVRERRERPSKRHGALALAGHVAGHPRIEIAVSRAQRSQEFRSPALTSPRGSTAEARCGRDL